MPRDNPDRVAKDLYAALERDGWSVVRIRAAVQKQRGVPDAVVCRKADRPRATLHFLEVKSPGGGLRPEQIEFATTTPACYHVVFSSWEAIQLLNECERLRREKRGAA